eukprot:jgi/Chlat1/298/Chrsp1S08782
MDVPLDAYEAQLGLTPAAYVIFIEFPLQDSDVALLRGFFAKLAPLGALAVVTAEPVSGLSLVSEPECRRLGTELAGAERAGVGGVVVRFAHEMNGSWYPWSQRPGEYREKFRLLAKVIKEMTCRTAMLWAPNNGGGYPFSGGVYECRKGECDDFNLLDTDGDGVLTMADDMYEPYYPGDDATDWVGMTIYHWGLKYPWGENHFTGTYNGSDGDQTAVPDFYATYSGEDSVHAKPFAIPETGAFFNTEYYGPGDDEFSIKQAWWIQVFNVYGDNSYAVDISVHFPRIHMINWFDWKKSEQEAYGGDIVDWSISLNPSIRDAFKSYITRPMADGRTYVKLRPELKWELGAIDTSLVPNSLSDVGVDLFDSSNPSTYYAGGRYPNLTLGTHNITVPIYFTSPHSFPTSRTLSLRAYLVPPGVDAATYACIRAADDVSIHAERGPNMGLAKKHVTTLAGPITLAACVGGLGVGEVEGSEREDETRACGSDELIERHSPLFLIDSSVSGYTALHAASVAGHVAALEWLLRRGASVRCIKEDGWRDTALHYAAANGNLACVQVLVAHGADIFARNFCDATAADLAEAAGNKEIVRYLEKIGEQITSGSESPGPRSSVRGTPLSFERLESLHNEDNEDKPEHAEHAHHFREQVQGLTVALSAARMLLDKRAAKANSNNNNNTGRSSVRSPVGLSRFAANVEEDNNEGEGEGGKGVVVGEVKTTTTTTVANSNGERKSRFASRVRFQADEEEDEVNAAVVGTPVLFSTEDDGDNNNNNSNNDGSASDVVDAEDVDVAEVGAPVVFSVELDDNNNNNNNTNNTNMHDDGADVGTPVVFSFEDSNKPHSQLLDRHVRFGGTMDRAGKSSPRRFPVTPRQGEINTNRLNPLARTPVFNTIVDGGHETTTTTTSQQLKQSPTLDLSGDDGEGDGEGEGVERSEQIASFPLEFDASDDEGDTATGDAESQMVDNVDKPSPAPPRTQPEVDGVAVGHDALSVLSAALPRLKLHKAQEEAAALSRLSPRRLSKEQHAEGRRQSKEQHAEGRRQSKEQHAEGRRQSKEEQHTTHPQAQAQAPTPVQAQAQAQLDASPSLLRANHSIAAHRLERWETSVGTTPDNRSPRVLSETKSLTPSPREPPRDARAVLERGWEGAGSAGTRLKEGTYVWRTLAVMCQVLGVIYFIWRALRTFNPNYMPLSIIFFVAEFISFIPSFIFVREMWSQIERDTRSLDELGIPEDEYPNVDVLIPCYTEPVDVVEATTCAALGMLYPPSKLTVYILDDGANDNVRAMAHKLEFQRKYLKRQAQVIYVSRKKAGHARGDYAVVFDCDMIAKQSFLMRTMPHFCIQARDGKWRFKEKAAFLQTPQDFYNVEPSDPMGHRARFFYGPMMQASRGRDGAGACPCVGTGVIFRRDALVSIGGQAYGSVTEDYNSAMCLQGAGFASMYLNSRMIFGMAPDDVANTFSQRLRWAMGSLQCMRTPEVPSIEAYILCRDNPLLKSGLTWTQSLLFFQSAFQYVMSVPTLFMACIPVAYFFFSAAPIYALIHEFLVFFFGYYLVNRLMLWHAHRGVEGGDLELWRGSQVIPNNLLACWKVFSTEWKVLSFLKLGKVGFAVTSKGPKNASWHTELATALKDTWHFVMYYIFAVAGMAYVVSLIARDKLAMTQIGSQAVAALWCVLIMAYVWPPLSTLNIWRKAQTGGQVLWHTPRAQDALPSRPATLRKSTFKFLQSMKKSFSLKRTGSNFARTPTKAHTNMDTNTDTMNTSDAATAANTAANSARDPLAEAGFNRESLRLNTKLRVNTMRPARLSEEGGEEEGLSGEERARMGAMVNERLKGDEEMQRDIALLYALSTNDSDDSSADPNNASSNANTLHPSRLGLAPDSPAARALSSFRAMVNASASSSTRSMDSNNNSAASSMRKGGDSFARVVAQVYPSEDLRQSLRRQQSMHPKDSLHEFTRYMTSRVVYEETVLRDHASLVATPTFRFKKAKHDNYTFLIVNCIMFLAFGIGGALYLILEQPPEDWLGF